MPSYNYTKFQKNPCVGRNERCPFVLFEIKSFKIVELSGYEYPRFLLKSLYRINSRKKCNFIIIIDTIVFGIYISNAIKDLKTLNSTKTLLQNFANPYLITKTDDIRVYVKTDLHI